MTIVPGGRSGRMEPVSMTYGVAPASRGTTTAASRMTPTPSITNQDSAWVTKCSLGRGRLLRVLSVITTPVAALTDDISRSDELLSGGDREIAERRAHALGVDGAHRR